MLRIGALASVTALLGAPVAQACGTWNFEDEERHRQVVFYASSIEVPPKVEKPGARRKTFGWFVHEDRICQWGGHKLTVREGRFEVGKKLYARLEGGRLETRGRTFDISLKPVPPDPKVDHGVPWWDVDVHSDGRSVAHGRAMSFTFCSNPTPQHREQEIRERVACYLTMAAHGR